MNIGSRLKMVLEEKEMTVSCLSRESGVSAQTIYAMIKRDSNKADLDILVQLLEALDIEAGEFLGLSAEESGKYPGMQSKNEKPENEKRTEQERRGSGETEGGYGTGEEFVRRLRDLAVSYDIADEAVMTDVFRTYLEEGFSSRPVSLAELMRRRRPQRTSSRDMDDFLL